MEPKYEAMKPYLDSPAPQKRALGSNRKASYRWETFLGNAMVSKESHVHKAGLKRCQVWILCYKTCTNTSYNPGVCNSMQEAAPSGLKLEKFFQVQESELA